jgi:hypothetical protein
LLVRRFSKAAVQFGRPHEASSSAAAVHGQRWRRLLLLLHADGVRAALICNCVWCMDVATMRVHAHCGIRTAEAA